MQVEDYQIMTNVPEDVYVETEQTLSRFDKLFWRSKGLRYGQLFLNIMAPKSPWPELYYKEKIDECKDMIRVWMVNYQNYGFVNTLLDHLERQGFDEFFRQQHGYSALGNTGSHS